MARSTFWVHRSNTALLSFAAAKTAALPGRIPQDASSGLALSAAASITTRPIIHCGPMPVVAHEGQPLQAPFEDCDPPGWGNFQAGVISAPADADLLDAVNWTMSNKLALRPKPGSRAGWDAEQANPAGWREGNVVVALLTDALWNILTFEGGAVLDEKAPRLRITQRRQDAELRSGDSGYIDFPGAKAKFVIRRDPVSGQIPRAGEYPWRTKISLSVWLSDLASQRYRARHPMRQRNVMSLTASDDLWHWRIVKSRT